MELNHANSSLYQKLTAAERCREQAFIVRHNLNGTGRPMDNPELQAAMSALQQHINELVTEAHRILNSCDSNHTADALALASSLPADLDQLTGQMSLVPAETPAILQDSYPPENGPHLGNILKLRNRMQSLCDAVDMASTPTKKPSGTEDAA